MGILPPVKGFLSFSASNGFGLMSQPYSQVGNLHDVHTSPLGLRRKRLVLFVGTIVGDCTIVCGVHPFTLWGLGLSLHLFMSCQTPTCINLCSLMSISGTSNGARGSFFSSAKQITPIKSSPLVWSRCAGSKLWLLTVECYSLATCRRTRHREDHEEMDWSKLIV